MKTQKCPLTVYIRSGCVIPLVKCYTDNQVYLLNFTIFKLLPEYSGVVEHLRRLKLNSVVGVN